MTSIRLAPEQRDGLEQRLIPGCFGIFGHGNVAGVGQALLEAQATKFADLRYYLARNEQAMVHASVGFARMRNRLQTFACTASIGPGSTNMVTGAALATINRIPVLLLPSDFFATRASNPVLQELEDPRSYDILVNDAFKPVSPIRPRPARRHLPCRRTSRRRRTTGRMTCSGCGSGTCPVRCPSLRPWPAPSACCDQRAGR